MKKQPFLFAISGIKNSGKTTLITKLIPVFQKYGFRTATIKHDGHDFEPDVPGTDTYRHFQAGAYGTAVFSGTKYMVVKQQEAVSEEILAACFPEADIILLEGFKYSDYPKIELMRKENSEKQVCADHRLMAIAADFPVKQKPDKTVPVLDLKNSEEIAEFILDCYFIKTRLSMTVLAGGLSSRMGCDKADLKYRGKTFLQTQIEKGKQLGIEEIMVSGYRGNTCSERIVKDRYPQRGPLGGLEAAFRETRREYSLVITVDVPLITVGVLRGLIRDFRQSRIQGNGSQVRVIRHRNHIEPLLGIYATDLTDVIEREIAEGKGSVVRFLEKIGYDVSENAAPENVFVNINDPESYGGLE